MTVTSVAEAAKANVLPHRRANPASDAENPSFAAILAESAPPSGLSPARPDATRDGKATGSPLASSLSRAGTGALGKSVPMPKSAQEVRAETAALAEDLQKRLVRAGVDTDVPVTLDVAQDGSIVVRGDHPDKAKIERLFAEDPDFANQYRKVSQDNAMIALGMVGVRYRIALDEAKDEEERDRVTRRFDAVIEKLGKSSGQMTLSGGQMSSASMDMAAGFLGVPSWAAG